MKRLYPKTTFFTDFTPFTPSITNGGTTSNNQGFWRKIGDTIHITVTTTFSGAGGAANLTYTLPLGVLSDQTKIWPGNSRAASGFALWYDASGPSQISYLPQLATQSTITFLHGGDSVVLQGNSLAVNDIVSFFVFVPIIGGTTRRGR